MTARGARTVLRGGAAWRALPPLVCAAVSTACGARWPDVYKLDAKSPCAVPAELLPAAIEKARARAEQWLEVAAFDAKTTYDSVPGGKLRWLPRKKGETYLAVVSYPGAPSDNTVHGRSFLYDDALAILWFAWTGDGETARGIANTLRLLQNADGSWGFSFSAGFNNYYNAAYVRSGANGWAVNALAYYGARHGDAAALEAARRGAAYLETLRVTDPAAYHAGLFTGGKGRWNRDYSQFFPDFDFEVAVTEHQLDIHAALARLDPQGADALAAAIVEKLWLPQEQRFALAADGERAQGERALDAAGGWGALWLLMAGREEMARASYAYSSSSFAAERWGLEGWKPYLDAVDAPWTGEWDSLIFTEGSLGLGLAALRLGDTATALRSLELAVELSCLSRSGVPYANMELQDFTTLPAVSSTLWFLFLERELRTGEAAPLFDGAGATEGGEA